MSKRQRHEEHEEHIDESWLIPYADLLTLLLALFIVLFASSKIDVDKFQAMSQAFQGIFSGGQGIMEGEGGHLNLEPGITGNEAEPLPTPTESLFNENDYQNLEELQSELETYFQENGLDASAYTHIDERGLVISFDNSILFDSGSVEIKMENIETLTNVAKTINNMDNYIRVEGHTDNIPIHNALYASNWELSALRATNVVRLFVQVAGIYPEKLVAVGYGEFRPIADNATPQGRSQNRRVDIIILNKKYNSLEEQLNTVPLLP